MRAPDNKSDKEIVDTLEFIYALDSTVFGQFQLYMIDAMLHNKRTFREALSQWIRKGEDG